MAAPDKDHTMTINQAAITVVTCGVNPSTWAGLAITFCSASVTGPGTLNRSLTRRSDHPPVVKGEDREPFHFTDGCFAFS